MSRREAVTKALDKLGRASPREMLRHSKQLSVEYLKIWNGRIDKKPQSHYTD